MYLLLVNGSKLGIKYFASLYLGACREDKIGLKGGQPLTRFLCTLQEIYIIPGLVFTGFRCLLVSSDMLLESTSFLKILSMSFSRLVIKFKKLSSFTAVL